MVVRRLALCCLLACGESDTGTPSRQHSEPRTTQQPSEKDATDASNESDVPTKPSNDPQKRQTIHGAPVMGQPSSHRVREPDPDHNRSVNPDIQRAMRLVETASYEEAKSILKQVINEYPEDPDAPYWMGQIYQIQGQHSDAVKWMQQATTLDPEFASAWWAVGFNYAIQRDCASALESQNRYIDLRPNDPSGYYNRASCRWYTKDRKGALTDGQKACDMGHQMACTHTQKQVKRQKLVEALEDERSKNNTVVPSTSTGMPANVGSSP